MAHPSREELESYLRRTLRSADFLSVDDHLAACEPCRRAAAEFFSPDLGAFDGISLRRKLEGAYLPYGPHLDEAQLEAYAAGSPADPTVEAHLLECPLCREEVSDLQAFLRDRESADEMPDEPDAPWRQLASLSRSLASQPPDEETWPPAAISRPTPTAPAAPARKTARPLRMWIAAGAALAATLAIAAVVWSTVHWPVPAHLQTTVTSTLAPSSLPPDLARLEQDALWSGQVALPAEIAELKGSAGVLRGRVGDPAGAALEYPLATATVSARPQFRWTLAARGAEAAGVKVRVALFTEDLREAASSGVLTGDSWQPPANLQPGEKYLWQLTVIRRGGQEVVPKPPAPQARFQVLAADVSARLQEAAAQYPNRHVLLGVLYARAGAVADATREWKLAEPSDPVRVGRLLKSIEAQ